MGGWVVTARFKLYCRNIYKTTDFEIFTRTVQFGSYTGRQRGRQGHAGRQERRNTCIDILYRNADGQTDRQRQTDRQLGRQLGRQAADRKTDTHKDTCCPFPGSLSYPISTFYP
jgi:hypothetical protein